MKNIKNFDSFNEMKDEKWIQDAIKKPGALRKAAEDRGLIKGDEKLSKTDLKKLAKVKGKTGQRARLAQTLRKIKEHQETNNYMFFGNLQTIKRLVDEMLEMDESKLDEILSKHNWALDHITTSKDDVEEVFNFLAGHNSPEETKKPLGGPESSHTVHDNHMINMTSEEGKNIKNFGNFNEDFEYDDEDVKPIGVDNMIEGTNGLVHIFTPLESDMVDDWNSDKTIQKWVEEGKVSLQEIKHDEWSIWGVEGDKEVKNYIKTRYSW